MSKSNYPLIVIEGGDGAGKGTQAKLLIETLKKCDINVALKDFPRYDQLFGGMCGKALKGSFGDFLALHPVIASALYTLDRVSAREELFQILEKNILISNRYTPSNVAYQAAKLQGVEKTEFIRYLEHAEYEVLGLPKPDLVIYLRVPVEISQGLIAKKDPREYLDGGKGVKDQYEADCAYQQRVANTYLELAEGRLDWQVVECTKEGIMRTPEDIHEEVFIIVKNVLKSFWNVFTYPPV